MAPEKTQTKPRFARQVRSHLGGQDWIICRVLSDYPSSSAIDYPNEDVNDRMFPTDTRVEKTRPSAAGMPQSSCMEGFTAWRVRSTRVSSAVSLRRSRQPSLRGNQVGLTGGKRKAPAGKHGRGKGVRIESARLLQPAGGGRNQNPVPLRNRRPAGTDAELRSLCLPR